MIDLDKCQRFLVLQRPLSDKETSALKNKQLTILKRIIREAKADVKTLSEMTEQQYELSQKPIGPDHPEYADASIMPVQGINMLEPEEGEVLPPAVDREKLQPDEHSDFS